MSHNLQMDTIAANEATDMWALGCIAFELLAGREIFGAQYSDEEVMSMLIGWAVNPSPSIPRHPSSPWGSSLQLSPESAALSVATQVRFECAFSPGSCTGGLGLSFQISLPPPLRLTATTRIPGCEVLGW